jgi:undecaprenyl-phosphate 4-deoxy-4-formamido-L-arabinose transferase
VTERTRAPEVSIVIPVFNAEATISALVERLTEVFAGTALQVVLVNDGSRDDSHGRCLGLVGKLPAVVTYLRLAKNFGEHNAVMAGLRHALGPWVVVMDDDFQNRPEDARRLVDEARANDRDLVYSSYLLKEHGWFRNFVSRLNGVVANLLLDKPKHLYLSSFKCMSGRLVREVVRYKGPFPYVDGLALRCTSDIGVVEVSHQPRLVGRSGYTLRKLFGLWLNMFLNFSVVPLRASTMLGLILVGGAALLTVYVALEKLSGRAVPAGWPFLAVIVMLFSGAQLTMLGLVGEYLGRLFLSINEMPQFVVRESHGVGADGEQPR